MNKKLVRVSAALIVKNKSFLAALRPVNKKLGGFWELPGGKVEPNEDPKDTCIREIREELNCNIKVNDKITVCTFDYPDFILQMDVFECELINDNYPSLIEHSALQWVNAQNIFDFKWVPADRDFLPLIKEKYLL